LADGGGGEVDLLHHVKGREIVRERKCPGEHVLGGCSDPGMTDKAIATGRHVTAAAAD